MNSMVIVFGELEECLVFSNYYVFEYLIFVIVNVDEFVCGVMNVGFVFVGNYSCESVGDYVSGINYIFFMNGVVISYSGVLFDSFVKKIMF